MRTNGAWVRGLVLVLGLVGAAGCGKRPSGDLLLVYSGDCQGYLDPCG
jgi:hypothetical protein